MIFTHQNGSWVNVLLVLPEWRLGPRGYLLTELFDVPESLELWCVNDLYH